MSFYINSEGYPDPTAGQALSKITSDMKRKERSDRRKAQRKKNAALRRQAAARKAEADEKDHTGPISGAG